MAARCVLAPVGAQENLSVYSKEQNAAIDPTAHSCIRLLIETLISASIPPKMHHLAAAVAARLQSDASASEAQLSASGAPVVERCSCQLALGKFHCIQTACLLQYCFIGIKERQVSRCQCLLVVM